jgi:hypothetical protein
MKQICTQSGAAIILAALKKRIYCLFILLFFLPSILRAQTNQVIPELVFQNPTLISGTAGQDGAIYKFADVASGIDATIKIVGRSSNSVKLSTIDSTGIGWSKAFQPVVGIPGNVSPNQNWWMEFQLRFYAGNSNNYKKIKSFQITAIDVDGDGQSLQEYIQMNRVTSNTYSPITYLTNPLAVASLCSYIGEDPDDLVGFDKKILGPIQNFSNVDTSATSVMTTFTFDNKDMIVFRFGGVTGSNGTTAGERMNSLWFKSFNLVSKSQSTLPLRLLNFQGNVNDNKASLQWSVTENETGNSFELEKSDNGKDFSPAALIFTTTKTGTEYYSFKESIGKTTFYRLKMTNKDNSVSYSKIIRLSVNEEASGNAVRILQNPVGSSLQFSYNVPSRENTTLNIYTSAGAKVFSTQIQSEKGNNTHMLNLDSKMDKGFYILEVTNGNERSISKFIKQ